MTRAIRDILDSVDLSLREIAQLTDKSKTGQLDKRVHHLSSSSLSRLASGKMKRPPKESLLLALHTFALGYKGRRRPICTWSELKALREALVAECQQKTSEVGGGCRPCVCGSCGKAIPRVSRDSGGPAEVGDADQPAVAPVPRSQGDRRNGNPMDLAWQPAADLSRHIAEGDFERASSMILHVSTQASPAEAARAMVACLDLGMEEIGQTISSYAGRNRSEGDVLEILRVLVEGEIRAETEVSLVRGILANVQAGIRSH